uniref:Integrase, catalytic region, zinc finger, CCHC-type, peptidase aspartic, catalytic n=1 Tax=Tanacetum cinerariifolium TaxID=118510 RepID=A0A6L2JA69_TANCI|nr:hypothetical protein [Tanacetum cinerariifolium]
MTTLITTSTTDTQMYNNIMAAGSRDRPPMLARGRYAQWQSRFMRYVDTKPNGDALRKCILEGPYKLSTVTIPGQPATDDSPTVKEQIVLEILSNMSSENKAHYNAEKEAIHLILTGIRDEVYLTIDACKTTHEMWIAIERFHKMMNEMVRNQFKVATMQVNVQFLQQLQIEWSRFVTVVKQTIVLDKKSYHKLFDILKQYQKEVDEIRAEKIARILNPLALVAATQQYPNTYYQAPKSYKSYAPTLKQSSSTRSHVSTRHKGKEIANQYKNDNQTGQFENQRTMTVAGDIETIGSQEVPTTNLGPSFDPEPLEEVHSNDEYNVFANEKQHSEQPISIDNTCVVEKVDSNVILDSSDMCDNENQSDQNAKDCDDERDVLANLIANLKLDTVENKKIQNQLKKVNTSLSHELQKCKSALDKYKSSLKNPNRT